MHESRLYNYIRKKHKRQKAAYIFLTAVATALAIIGFFRPHGYGTLAIKAAYLNYRSAQLHAENTELRQDMEKLMPPCMKKGEFTLTAYEKTARSCGKWAKYGKTSSNTTPAVFRTAAVDPTLIKPLSLIYAKGLGWFIAEDRGSAIKGKRLDIYMTNVAEALLFGKKKATVYYQDSQCFAKLLTDRKYASAIDNATAEMSHTD